MTRRGHPDFLCPPTPLQPRIVAKLNLTSPDLFRLVFRYVNRGPTSVSGRVSMRDEGKFTTCPNCECWGCPLPTQPLPHPPSPPSSHHIPMRGWGGQASPDPGGLVTVACSGHLTPASRKPTVPTPRHRAEPARGLPT